MKTTSAAGRELKCHKCGIPHHADSLWEVFDYLFCSSCHQRGQDAWVDLEFNTLYEAIMARGMPKFWWRRNQKGRK